MLYVLVFSSFVTLILTALQLRIDYNYGVEDIDKRLELIQITNIESITESLWTVDETLMKIQMEGLSRLPDVIFVEITDESGATIVAAGNIDTPHTIERSYALNKVYRGIDTRLGRLHIVATKLNVYQRLIDTVLIILVSQAIKTFLVSMFILFIFNMLVTRHLSKIASFLESINIQKKPDHFELDRRIPEMQKGDELDRVVYSINNMMDENHRHYVDLRENRHRLSESESRFSAIFNAITDSIAVSDVHGNIMLVNPAFRKQFKYPEVTPKTLDTILAKHSRQSSAMDIYQQVINQSMGKVYESSFMRSDHSEFSGEMTSSKVIQPDGKHIAYLSIIRDITNRKQNEAEKTQLMEELQQAQKMEAIGLLVGGIAHDFNNILGSIMGYSELASELVGSDQALLKKYLASVMSSSERASGLIKQLLAFSRRGSSEPVQLEVDELLDEVTMMLKPLLPATIDLKLIKSGTASICFDTTQIQQVLLNLCLNARDAMQGRGSLTITVENKSISQNICFSCHKKISGDFVSIRISDTGSGITEDVLKNIFNPFFTTKSQGEGTGMGLSVVHGILHKHESHILVESTIGAGTQFELLIPAVESTIKPEMVRVEKSQPEVVDVTNRHILVVDDESMLAEYLQDLLEGYDYKVTACTDPLEALKLFQAEHKSIDLLITDQTMPQMTGIELIRQLLIYKPELPVILCSGLSDVVAEHEMEKCGVTMYLQKPVKAPDLLKSIAKALAE